MTTNHTTMTGPKTAPTLLVPRLWAAKRPMIMTMVAGIIKDLRAGVAISSPSTALSTEMAGVIMPSP